MAVGGQGREKAQGLHAEPDQRICALALHLAGRFHTDKYARLLEQTEFVELARVILHTTFTGFCREAAEILQATPDMIVTFGGEDYPQALSEIDYAPFALYAKGNRALLRRELISIVGTREPSAAGRVAAANLAKAAAAHGQVVVSGIARGIDSIAHHAALQYSGQTIAVLPNGFNHLYPLENRDIYAQAEKSPNLLLLSEYPPAMRPQRHHFVRRNRIIAGLSMMTIFVEGGIKSGGMITVNHALTAGRDVAALVHESLTQNEGGEKLVSEGALNLTEQALLPRTSGVSA